MSRVDSISESRPRAIPKITVRIDRGEDWAEISEDWQTGHSVICVWCGDVENWLDYKKLKDVFSILNEAVKER